VWELRRELERGGERRGGHTLEDWRVRWRTVIVWSWAVTSLRFFGRLVLCQYCYGLLPEEVIAYYFSTHGWTLLVSFGGGALLDVPFVAAASLRALRSKNDAISKRAVRMSWD
jgi:hypothetical protein